jgi:hypothetical protein
MSAYSLRHLPDAVLAQKLQTSTADDRRSVARNIARIAEYDRRRLYLPAGCRSMFRYCVDRLRMSEDVAVQRIRVGRAALEFPAIFEALAEGRISPTTVALVASHLDTTNAPDLLAAVAGKPIQQVRRVLAERFGAARQPGAFTPDLGAAPEPVVAASAKVEAGELPVSKRVVPTFTMSADASADAPVEPVPAGGAAPTPRRARLTPVGPERFELVAILGQEAYDQLVASRELLSHAVPSGDLAEVLERAIALQFAHLRRRRCAATARLRSGPAKKAGAASQPGVASQPGAARRSAHPRHIPAAVRREVWERDGGQCTFVGTGGHVCGARERIELDHVVPVARGGTSTVGNLRLLCREHNQFVAEQALGKAQVQARREAAQRQRAADRAHKEAEREREAARKAALQQQDDELGTALRTLGYRGEKLHRALAHCVARAEAPLEERLKYALGCMAPTARREAPAPSAPTSP